MTEPGRRTPSDIRFRTALEALTARVGIYRKHMAITRDEMKAKRLAAMAVVGAQTQASADMFDRVIAAGAKVAAAREAAETAQMGALDAHVADLNEMADDLKDFANAVPTPGGTSGTASLITAAAPVKTTVQPATVSVVSVALKALNEAQPNPTSEAWAKGDAYVGTHPDAPKA